MKREVLSRTFLATIIQREDLYKPERRNEPLEDIAARMREEKVEIAPAANGAFRVSFLDDDPARAQRLAHWIQNQMVHLEPSLHVAAAPAVPNAAIPPSRWPALWYGLAAGLLAGALGALLWRRPLRSTLRIAAFTIAGGLLGYGYFFAWAIGWGPGMAIADHFTTNAVLRAPDAAAVEQQLANPVILQKAIADAAIYRRQPQTALDRMRRDLHIVRLPSPGADLLVLSFTYTDRYKAQTALRSVVDRLRVEVIDPCSLPEEGIFRPWHFIAVGILLGLLASLIRWHRRPSFHLQHAGI